MIEIACTQCGKRYKVKEEVQGKRVRCAACKVEFEAQPAVCLMELALMQPSLKLVEAIRTGSLSDLGFFLNHHFTMIQAPGVEGYSPLTCEVKLERKKFMSIVVFTSAERSGVFAGKNSGMLDEAGELSGFVMEGWQLVKHSPKDVGFLVDPESEHASLLAPADWEPLRKALVRFEREPQLKAAIPQPHPQAGAQSHLTDAASIVRNQSFAYLDYMGFQCARWLPAPDMSRQLRPTLEIAGRLAALAGVFAWGSAPPEAIPNRALSDYFKKSSLSKYLTKEEAAIVTTPRQQAMEKHQHQVGWLLENMWPLAWVLGFDSEPDIDGNQIDQDISMRIIMEFLDKVSISLDDLVRKSQVRTQHEVVAKEDLFYCAHNAVRCAQTGQSTVPAGFDPVANGGVIHERRRSLTWCLSPGVRWHDTDLST